MVRVVFTVIDALPNHWVGPEWTPHLWSLVDTGGWNPEGGQAILSTATYPNHASFATGTDATGHGIFTNRVWAGDQFVDSCRIGPKGETLFQAATAAGRSSTAVVGDHKLIGVMGADRADRHWPPGGRRADVALDEFRYAADSSVLEALDAVAGLDADLAMVHFNEPDTACHLHGPDAAETAVRVRATDTALGQLVERARDRWADTVMIVVSDHDQERVTNHGFDLAAALAERGLPGHVEDEGTAALVFDGPELDELRSIEGIASGVELDGHHTLVWGPPGQVFGFWLDDLHGSHGSPRCRRQVAVVGGGHPDVAALAASLASRRPDATDWAPTIAELLEMPLPAATGRSLLGRPSR